jgi:hypothetical protein
MAQSGKAATKEIEQEETEEIPMPSGFSVLSVFSCSKFFICFLRRDLRSTAFPTAFSCSHLHFGAEGKNLRENKGILLIVARMARMKGVLSESIFHPCDPNHNSDESCNSNKIFTVRVVQSVTPQQIRTERHLPADHADGRR